MPLCSIFVTQYMCMTADTRSTIFYDGRFPHNSYPHVFQNQAHKLYCAIMYYSPSQAFRNHYMGGNDWIVLIFSSHDTKSEFLKSGLWKTFG